MSVAIFSRSASVSGSGSCVSIQRDKSSSVLMSLSAAWLSSEKALFAAGPTWDAMIADSLRNARLVVPETFAASQRSRKASVTANSECHSSPNRVAAKTTASWRPPSRRSSSSGSISAPSRSPMASDCAWIQFVRNRGCFLRSSNSTSRHRPL